MIVVFEAELYLWDARRIDTWTFVSLPADVSEEIRARSGGVRRGFGSLRVLVTVGSSTWSTSIFPSGGGHYVLPIKRKVRESERIDVGDTVAATVDVIDCR